MSSERKEPTVSSVLHSRDQLSDSQLSSARQAASEQISGRPISPSQSSTGFLWFTFLMTLIAVSSTTYALWQLHYTQTVIGEQHLRIVKLERKLTTSDDTAAQTLVSVGVKLRELDKKTRVMTSEIDKLWAARNVNRKAIADGGKKIASLQKELKNTSSQLAKMDKKAVTISTNVSDLGRSVNDLKGLKGTFSTVDQNVSEQELLLESLRERMANQASTLKQLSSSVKTGKALAKQVRSMGVRLKNTEEAMVSVEAFRRTVNRDLLQLKQGDAIKP